MSIFVPFKAYRPQQKYAQNIASKPYDVLNAKEAKLEALDNPISFYNVIKPEINFSEDSNYYAPEVYEKGKAVFDDFVSKNILKQDSNESYYVYELTTGDHTQTGLVGCCSIDDYFNNTIKKHELTRPDKEEDRKNHVRYSALNYEAVFLSYPQVTGIDQLVNITKKEKHLYDFISDDDIRHRLWAITNKEILQKIASLFRTKVPKIYIADGHHRTAAGALVGKEFRDSRNGNLDDKKRELISNEKRLNSTVFYFTITLSLLIIILIIFRINFKLQSERSKRFKLEKSQIENELSLKQRELFSKSNFILQRNDYLKSILEEVNNNTNSQKAVDRIKKQVSGIINSESLYQEFDKKFVEVFPEFYKKLNANYSLSKTDFRLIAYIKMNKSNNEIARISGISIRTIQSQRYRLSKKLKLEKNQDLNSFIFDV